DTIAFRMGQPKPADRPPLVVTRDNRPDVEWKGIMTRTAVDTHENWLDPEDLARARRQLPILYINAVPIRVDDLGSVTSVGLLLRSSAEGDINREVIAGRVLFHERIRDALHRHIEKDL